MVLGRVAERAALDELLDGALQHRSGSLVLIGDPGIGKSTLLGYARDRAVEGGFGQPDVPGAAGGGPMAVLSARGYESESEIAFAGLADLLTPVLPFLDRLPEPQQVALRGALSLGPATSGDRFSVCAATIGLLAAAAEERPLLVLVDDAHWLDTSSREAIVFAARRVQAEGIVLLLASRPGSARGSEFAGLRELRLAGLTRADTDALCDSVLPGAPAELRRRLYSDTGGNPLGVLELCAQWDQPSGNGPVDPPLPITPGVGIPPDSQLNRALGARLAVLPDRTRRALLLVAAAGGADRDVVLRAIDRSGLSLADLEPAELADLLDVDESRIGFRHPLLRTVSYAAASSHARASAHAALAEVLAELPGEAAADQRAWHLVAARLAPDQEVAELLWSAADRARRRGGPLEAARAFEQAARFATESEQRVGLLLRAARCWQLAGRSGRVLPLLDQATPLASDPRQLALIRHMDAYVRMWRLRPAQALTAMVAGAEQIEPIDPGRAALMYADAAIACYMLGDADELLALTERAYRISRGVPGVAPLVVTVALAGALAMHGRRLEAARLLDAWQDELARSEPLSRAQEFAHAAFTLIWLEDFSRAEWLLDRVVGAARQAGALGVLPQVLTIVSEIYFRAGRWPEARAAAQECVTLAAETRQPVLYGMFFVARLDAVQGRAADCRRLIEQIRAGAVRFGAPVLDYYTGHALGLLALGSNDCEQAIAQLEAVAALPVAAMITEQAVVPWAYDLVEAYARAGRADQAQALLDRVAPPPANADGQPPGSAGGRWEHAVSWRCRGLLAPRDNMFDAFEQSLAWHERTDQPFERARTLLCFGERLRRARMRAPARQHLRAALEIFERLDATPWAARARAELKATGETLARGHGPAAQLTPQELQVAMVVARGMSNSEAAAALFLSPKTIEYHLSNIYRKTALRSRADLSVLLAS